MVLVLKLVELEAEMHFRKHPALQNSGNDPLVAPRMCKKASGPNFSYWQVSLAYWCNKTLKTCFQLSDAVTG